MRLLALFPVAAAQLGLAAVLYWSRVRGFGPGSWDAVAFGVPLVAGVAAYRSVLLSGAFARPVPASWRGWRSIVIAVVLGVAVQVVAMAIEFNVFGT